MVEADPDRLRRLVERRPDVGVLAELVAPDRLDDQASQLVDRRDVLHQEDPARLADPLDVLTDLHPVELALLRVPVGADPLERRGPVHERVGHDADLRVTHRDECALEVGDDVIEAARDRRGSVRIRRRRRLWGGRGVGRARLLAQHAELLRGRRRGRRGVI